MCNVLVYAMHGCASESFRVGITSGPGQLLSLNAGLY